MFLIVLPCSSICCVGILCQTMSYAIQMMFSVQVLIMFVIKCSPVGDGWGGYFRNSSKSRISCRTNITFNRLMMTLWDSWYAFIQSWTEDVRFCFLITISRFFRENITITIVIRDIFGKTFSFQLFFTVLVVIEAILHHRKASIYFQHFLQLQTWRNSTFQDTK